LNVNNFELDSNNKKKILTANLGQCVHIAGSYNFSQIASLLGYECKILPPVTPIKNLIKEIINYNPHIVGLSYRLTSSTIKPLLTEFFSYYKKHKLKPKRLLFAGTPEVVKVVKKNFTFDRYFVGGESKFEIISTLKNRKYKIGENVRIPMDLIDRINWKKPFPIIRAHFGLPTLKETLKGIKEIASAEVLDVISIAPDQNTQENYFHPEKRKKKLSGAGGVPIKSREDFLQIHKARLTGNSPLLRIYAGTRDFIKLAKLYRDTIQNAWAAIPIFWFNQMDGRGPLSLEKSIMQHLKAIKWHAINNIPVEVNDSHHWSLRNAPDAVSVADMYLSGIIAKKLGIKHFIAQYMFNTPPSSSFDMDLAKILAKDELLHTLIDDSFKVIKQVRTGLASFPLDKNKAKGQLAAATLIQLAIKPDIVHVVSFSEANHAAQAKEIIESCNIVEQVINQCYSSKINLVDENILKRKEKLVNEAKFLISLIPKLAKTEIEMKYPWTNYNVLARIVKYGIFDTPQLHNNKFALGHIKTKMIDGACYSWDEINQRVIDEKERVNSLIANNPEIFSNEAKDYSSINILGDEIECDLV
jgi:methylmalonyl-CoA mutase cobalamin-binding subunit